jgi:hypothetical protein
VTHSPPNPVRVNGTAHFLGEISFLKILVPVLFNLNPTSRWERGGQLISSSTKIALSHSCLLKNTVVTYSRVEQRNADALVRTLGATHLFTLLSPQNYSSKTDPIINSQQDEH